MIARGARAGGIVVVRLAYGDLLLESLQEICRVLSLAEIALVGIDGIEMARRLDPTTGQKLLQSVTSYATRNGGPDQEGSLVTVGHRLSKRRPR